DELAVSMVRAGQEGGFLEDVLKRVATFVEHQEDLKAKVVGAMVYPLVLACVMFLVINVLVIFFVPLFEPAVEKLKAKGQLPWMTQKLMAGRHFEQSGAEVVTAVVGFVARVASCMWTRVGGRV